MKIGIIGGGPAGIFAALKASEKNDVTLFEKNNVLGKKFLITGGGRCNITNKSRMSNHLKNVVNNSNFLRHAYKNYGNIDLLKYLNSIGCEFIEEDRGKLFSKDGSSKNILNKIINELNIKNVEIKTSANIEDLIIKGEKVIGLRLNNKDLFFDKIIIASGGATYTQTGSDGYILNILKKYNHNIIKLKPALSPLKIKEDYLYNLSGISFSEVEIRTKLNNKKIKVQDSLLFTHNSISGLASLKISSYINVIDFSKEEKLITIDFLPKMSFEDLEIWFKDRIKLKKEIINELYKILPKNFIKTILKENNIDYKRQLNSFSNKEINKIIDLIKNFNISVIGLEDINKALVTSGGVDTKEINNKTMESKLIKNLYFAGEIIDVDALTGGYNLQISFSTGYLAGELK